MNDTQATAPLTTAQYEPDVRFSIRALLLATTIVAIISASLAPFFQLQTETGQRRLLFVWTTALLSYGLLTYYNAARARQRTARTKAAIGDDSLYQLRVVPKAFEEAMRRPRRLLVRLLGMIAFILLCSLLPLIDYESPSRVDLIALGNLLYGCGIGVIAYTLLMERSASVVFLRDSGVNVDARFIAWTSFGDAQRLTKRPNVLKLRYLDADILVETPAQIRDKIEAFVNEQVAAAEREKLDR